MKQPSQATKRLIALVITIAMVLMSFSSILAATETEAANTTDFVPGAVEGDDSIDPNSDVMILVKVDGTSALQQTKSVKNAAKVAEKMLAKLPAQIERVETKLGEKIEVKDQFALLFNGFSFEGKYWMLEELNKLDGITAFIPATFEVAADDDNGSIVTPNTSNSTVTIGAQEAWDLGYTGEGTFIAIIDTGIRHTHEAFSVMPTNTKVDVAYLENIVSQYGDLLHCGLDASQLYYSAKQAFNWDYYDNDYDPNHTASDHGTHVAGIAAGNNGSDFKGVAPDAQLAVMQVFEASGSAYFTTLLKALEDCAYLGVDAINMSLGSVAGFTTPYPSVVGLAEALDALEEAGISVNAAAGNDMNTTLWTTYGNWFVSNYKTLSTNPDYGLVGSPSTFPSVFSVASVVNGNSSTGYLKVDGVSYFYGSTTSCEVLGSIPGTYRIVYAGFGSAEEFEAIDAEGAIALISRGNGITFTDKCTNAAAAGAVGVLMFNNVVGSFNPSVTSTIPLGLLSLSEGQAIVEQLNGGVTECTIVPGVSYGSIKMASTSSWGTTADLKIKPEIAAPGDGVYSAVGADTDTSYESWSGTSMATPHISAALSIIKQRLREIFPNAGTAEINELAYAFAMSTANQVNGFVRQQGAGLIDIYKAISTDVYLTVPDSSRPKLEVGESEDGTFTFTFVLNNIGSVDHTYSISVKALIEQISTETYTGHWTHEEEPTEVNLIGGAIDDVSDMVTNNAPASVTVPAGESVAVTMTIAANEELMSYFDEYFPVGAFLEGWVKLTEDAEDGIDLSIPFLGYVGDWDEPSML
ncbi:MAG: S8 family serine peptidase, partial [Clostridiales bacterium]|nr:S8 family serine peptidase [Clostridiales bacterium]